MKKYKGFTLIEVIATITILGLIVSLSLTVVMKTIRNSENKQYNSVITVIITAAESYVNQNREILPSLGTVGDSFNISLSKLRDEGLISSDLVNPKTNELFNYNTTVKIKTIVIGKKEEYTYSGE
ncbi:MAG: type II secretion system protein [Bacilli bacterium]